MYLLNAMSIQLPSWLSRQRPVFIGLLVLVFPLCLLAGGPTAGFTTAGTCQPQAVTADFCTKVIHQSEIAAVLPGAVARATGSGLIPHLIWSQDSLDHPLPGYLTTPSGRSPPLL